MLKWVVKSGQSSTPKDSSSGLNKKATSQEIQNESFASEETQADSVLDNSDSLIEWHISKDSTDSKLATTPDDGGRPDVCHGMNADSGISTSSHLEESFSGNNNEESGNDSARHSQSSNSSDDEFSSPCESHKTSVHSVIDQDHPRKLPLRSSPAESTCTNSEFETNSNSENSSLNGLHCYTWSAIDFHETTSSSRNKNLRNLKCKSADNFDSYIEESSSDCEDAYSQISGTRSVDLAGHYTDSELCEDLYVTAGYCSGTESLDEVFQAEKHVVRCRPRKPVCRRKKKKSFFLSKLTSADTDHEDIHVKRSKLVDQIDRENKLKIGAENLFRATANKRLKQTVEVELKFIQSHIQLLTEELSEMDVSGENKNSESQSNSIHRGFPMIQIGLKETKDIDFQCAFKNYIEDHYFENGDLFTKEIEDLETLRQMVRSPLPTDEGAALLFEYYNYLFFVDKRLFPPGRSIGVHFPWFDALNGSLTSQRTVGFEKGCILFNIAALYSQIGAQKKRTCEKDCQLVSDYFLKAMGTLKFLHDNFSYAPSTDMQSHTLKVLIQILASQSEECMFDVQCHNKSADTAEEHVELGQQAAKVYETYRYARQLMHFDNIQEYLPYKWHILVQVKTLYYKALCNYHAALAVLKLQSESHPESGAVCDMFETLPPSRSSAYVSRENLADFSVSSYIQGAETERKHIAKACLSRSVLAHEEALRVHCHNQKTKRIPYYHDVHHILKSAHDRCFHTYSELDEEDDFTELSTIPNVKGKSSHTLQAIMPDLSAYKVTDPFQKLGPLAIFCAKHYWTEPQRVELHKKDGQEFGFSVRGEAPVLVAEVDAGSIAEKAGLHPGDFIVHISKKDVKWFKHEDIVRLVRSFGNNLVISVVSPLDKNYLNPRPPSECRDMGDKGADGKSVMQSSTLDRHKPIRLSGRSTKSLTWTLKRFKPVTHRNKRHHVKELLNADRNKR